jgi:hypothetical protein
MITGPLLTCGLVCAVALLVRRVAPRPEPRGWRALDSGWASVAAGCVTAAMVWYVMGTLRRVPVVDDEAAYLLQAGIFATVHWTVPSPPLPEFFEQLYVLVTPVLASKYWPGQSVVMAPGARLGLPGLAPVVLSGVAGGLVYALCRRAAGRVAALLTTLLWLSAPATLYDRAAYMSEVTTATAWLIAWWGLLQWRDRRPGGGAPLALSGAAVGLTLITRPLAGIALALPIVLVACRIAWQRRPAQGFRHSWGAVGTAAGVMVVVCAIIPVWSARTTGSWRDTPLALYTAQYMPFDRPGFGVGSAAAVRALPADLAQETDAFRRLHQAYQPAAIPFMLLGRIIGIARDVWGGWRLGLLPFAVVGCVGLGAEGMFALASVALLIALSLCYAHPPGFSLYYLEGEPVLALVTALGVIRVVRAQRVPLVAVGLAAGLVAATVVTVTRVRTAVRNDGAYRAAFAALVSGIPDRQAIVFVRYGPSHNANQGLVRNVVDLGHARVWIVHDRGTDDVRLSAQAPERTPYLFDETRGSLTRMPLP